MLGCANPRALALPNTITVKGAKHNDHRAWGEARCPSQTQTRQGGLGWGAGSWAWPSLGPWPWRWAWRVGLGLAAALIGTSALSTLLSRPLSLPWATSAMSLRIIASPKDSKFFATMTKAPGPTMTLAR